VCVCVLHVLGIHGVCVWFVGGIWHVECETCDMTSSFSLPSSQTSFTLLFTLYCLAKNPTAQQQLRDEINRVWDGEEELTPAHFTQMKLLSGSLKEAQRLYPAAPFNARVLKQDLVLSGYDVPQGVSLRHIVHRDVDESKTQRYTYLHVMYMHVYY